MTNLMDSGSFAPTVTDISNITSSSAHNTLWAKEDKMVTMGGALTITPTSASTTTAVDLSLPVPSDLTSALQGSGAGGVGNVFGYQAGMSVNGSTDRARFTFISDASAGAVTFQYIYMYEGL